MIEKLTWEPLTHKHKGTFGVGMEMLGMEADGSMSMAQLISLNVGGTSYEVQLFPGTKYTSIPGDSAAFHVSIPYTDRRIPLPDGVHFNVEGLYLTEAISHFLPEKPDSTSVVNAIDKVIDHIWDVTDPIVAIPKSTVEYNKVFSANIQKLAYQQMLIQKLGSINHEIMLVTSIKPE